MSSPQLTFDIGLAQQLARNGLNRSRTRRKVFDRIDWTTVVCSRSDLKLCPVTADSFNLSRCRSAANALSCYLRQEVESTLFAAVDFGEVAELHICNFHDPEHGIPG